MRKKQLNLLGIVLFLAVVLAGAWYFNLFSLPQSLYGGLTGITIQKDEVVSDNPFFSEPVYHIVAVVSPNSREIRGETDLTGMPLKLTISGTSNTRCLYKISNQSQKIRYWETVYPSFDDCVYPYPGGCRCDCNQYGCQLNCEWSEITSRLAGEVYYIEPVPFYDYNITINFNVGGVNVPIYLTSDKTADYIQDFAYAQLLGSLQGQQGCPALYTDAMIWRQPSSSNMTLIWKYAAQDAIATQNKPSPQKDWGAAAEEYNNTINYAKNTAYKPYGFQCKLYNISPTETNILCDAIGEVAYPVVDMYVKASVLRQYIPTGKPQILNVSCPKVEAVAKSVCYVLVRNTANQKDTFEVGVQGFKDITPFSVRKEIDAGKEATVEVPYSGSGIIGKFKVYAFSVNAPDLRDEQTVKIVIEPFCDTPKPGCANAKKIMTEKGCFWYCPDYYTKEIGEYSGLEIETLMLEMIGKPHYQDEYGNLINYTVSDVIDKLRDAGEEYHCVDNGKRVSINDYVYKRDDGRISAYIPKDRRNEHLYFIPAFYQKYYCTYLAEYGYHYDAKLNRVFGVEGNEEFNYDDKLTPEEYVKGDGDGSRGLPFTDQISNFIQDISSGTTNIPFIGEVSNAILLGIVGGFLILGLTAGAPAIVKFIRGIRL